MFCAIYPERYKYNQKPARIFVHYPILIIYPEGYIIQTERNNTPPHNKRRNNMNEMINKIGERLVVKARVVNIYRNDEKYAHNIRTCPFYSEFRGMIEMLKTLDIDYDIDFSADLSQMTAITVAGKRFEV